MKNSSKKPAPVKAFEILGGMFNTQVVVALAQLNVFETIGHEVKTIDELATACNANKNVLLRTLRYATHIDIVHNADGKYALTETGKFFLKDSPGSLCGSMNFLSKRPWRDSWDNFSHCLKTGEPAFNNVFGMPFFEYLDKNQEYGKVFNDYMMKLTNMSSPLIPNYYDFGSFSTICDVGGGQGILLKAILEKYTGCKGILFDMESVLQHHVMGELANRTEFVSGSFFDTIPNADCMLLKTVIHDWNNENSIRILNNCKNALNKGGKIILVEQVIEMPYTFHSLFYDLHMQVMLGGAERTEEEFRDILKQAGLKLERIIATPSPMKLLEISVE